MTFRSTFLYIKQHRDTRKLYFGKTVSNPEVYQGSGKRWKHHILAHGNSVDTLWYCLFTDKAELTKFALMCSEIWSIVESKDWLNLKPENGIDGGSDEKHMKMMQAKARMSDKFNKNQDHQRKFREASIGHHTGVTDPEKLAELRKKSHDSPNHPSKRIVTCPHCGKTGNMLSLSRCHFDNCKLKLGEQT